jgi:tRNA U55 pseudouridine synthase TruB
VPAHLAALRRTRIGPLDVAGAFDPFAAAALPAPRPLAEAVSHLPARAVDAELERRLRMGQQRALESLGQPPPAPVRLLDGEGRLVAIAAAGEHGWSLERVFAPRPVEPAHVSS